MADQQHDTRRDRRPFEPTPAAAPVQRGERPWPETGAEPRRREPLPRPKLAELRSLIRKVAALEARERGQDVQCLDGGAVPPRIVGVDLDRLSPGEELASIGAACALVEACIWSAGEEIKLVARDGHQIAGSELGA